MAVLKLILKYKKNLLAYCFASFRELMLAKSWQVNDGDF